MKIKIQISLILSLLILLTLTLSAQEGEGGGYNVNFGEEVLKRQNTVVPPSPNAASLGQYGEFNADTYTGALSLQIPLGGLSGQYIGHNVSLSYSSNGYMKNQAVSWVGASWVLNAGGVISRTVRGIVDGDGTYYGRERFSDFNVDDFTRLKEMAKIETNCIDIKPDLFNLTVGELSCQFIITNEKQIIYSKKGVVKRIEPNFVIELGVSRLKSFTVYDYLNNVYIFRDTEVTIQDPNDDGRSCPDFQEVNEYYSSWYLSEFYNNSMATQKIVFEYDDEVHSTNLIVNDDAFNWSKDGEDPNSPQCEGNPNKRISYRNPSRIKDRLFLERISLLLNGVALEHVEFSKPKDYDPSESFEEYILERISFYKGGKRVNNWKIDYDHPKGRTVPVSLSQYNGGVLIPEYTFEYDQTENISTNVFNSFVKDKRLDVRIGDILLSKVTYPTGGYSEYVFEQHEVNHQNNARRKVGGHRIRSVKKLDEEGEELDSYLYEYKMDDGLSSGIIFSDPEFTKRNLLPETVECSELNPGAPGNPACNFEIEFNYSITPIISHRGSHVGYGKVKMSKPGLLGHTEYNFHNEVFDNSNIFGFSLNGTLEKKLTSGSSGLLVEETYINEITREGDSYREYELLPFEIGNNIACKNPDGSFAAGVLCECEDAVGNDNILFSGNRVWSGTTYSWSSRQLFELAYTNVKSVTSVEYFPSGSIDKTVEYEYHSVFNTITSNKLVRNSDKKSYEIKTVYGNNDIALPSVRAKYVGGEFQEGEGTTYVGVRPVEYRHLLEVEPRGSGDIYFGNLIRKIVYEDGFLVREEYFPGSELEPTEYRWDFGSGLLDGTTQGNRINDFTYSNNRSLRSHTNANRYKTRYSYDDLVRLDMVEELPIGFDFLVEKTIKYDYQNREITSTTEFDDRERQVVINRFDGLGRSTESVSLDFSEGEDVVTADIGYDNFGRKKSELVLPGGGNMTYTYENNLLNRVESMDPPGEGNVRYEYGVMIIDDEKHYTITTYDENDNATTEVKDKVGRLVQTIDANEGVTKYSYYKHGRIERILSPENKSYNYFYDDKLLLERKEVPGRGASTYINNSLYQLESTADANGTQITYTYDNYGRAIREDISTIDGNYVVSYVYDVCDGTPDCEDGDNTIGQLLVTKSDLLDGSGTTVTVNKYDAYGRPIGSEIKDPTNLGYAQGFTLNSAGEMISSSTSIGTITQLGSYEYDTWGRVKMSATTVNGSLMQLVNNKYESTGLLRSKNLGGLQSVDYHYNERGWLRSINQDLGSFSTLSALAACDEINFGLDNDEVQPILPDMVSVTELLSRRFNLDITSTETNLICGKKECPELVCEQAELDGQRLSYETINETILNEISVVFSIPCVVDGLETIREEKKISLEKLVFPFTVLRVRLCGDISVYLLDAYLEQLTGSYEIEQSIDVTNPDQTFTMNYDGTVHEIDLQTFLQRIFETQYESYKINNYVECGDEECTTLEYNCSSQDYASQQTALEIIQEIQEYSSLPCSQEVGLSGLGEVFVSFPLTLFELALCDGSSFWATELEYNSYFEGTGVTIVDTKIYSSCEEEVPMSDIIEPLDKLDLFCLQLDYEPNGNIATQYWQVAGRNVMKYGYDYDELNRIKSGLFSEFGASSQGGTKSLEDRFSVSGINYDLDGNITSLKRNGINGYCRPGIPDFGPIDDLVYVYGGGTRLRSVTDAVPASSGGDYGLPSYGNEELYEYDANGNVTFDPTRGVTISYNYLNLPELINFPNGRSVKYTYDASGLKWRREFINGENSKVTDYIGNVEFVNEEVSAVYLEEGRAAKIEEGFQMEYVLRDHLGNTRITFSDVDGDGEISKLESKGEVLQEHHYYPFGMSWENSVNSPWYRHPKVGDGGDSKYQYNGKELQDEKLFTTEQDVDIMLGYYDYGFRWYDPAIGRFTGVDPIADQFAHVSVYNYAENSPIRYIDLWGLQKADPPIFRASFHGALTAGESGFEVNALGAKVGGTVKHGGGDILGINIKADEINGGDISGTRAFSNNEETFGVSGGDVFGGEISITTNTEDGSFVQKSSASLGLFYLKNEYTKDAEGNKDNQQFIGVEFSASAGFILGFDLNLSLEINVSSPDAPEGWESPLDLPTEAPQDNTTVIIPLPINDINEEN